MPKNLKKSLAKKSDSDLNEKQQEAVFHKNGAVLVVAGAGTGKTRVITERIKHLIEDQNLKPNEILALTFTEKASAEMLERLGDVMPLGYEEPWVYTFHSFADRVLRMDGLEIGLDPTYKIIAYSQQWLLLRKNIFKLKLNYYRPLGNPTKFISAILKFISRLQDEYISVEDFEKFVLNIKDPDEKEKYNELLYIYKNYQELKIQNSQMDFGDLITYVIKILKERKTVLDKYQDQFKHILIDEFQDTNYAQYELIKLLYPKPEKAKSLLVVGDDSQSIYKFRGAAVSNILEFMQDYPSAKMISLLTNYRSSQKILDPAYKLIQNNNPDTLESKLGISKQLISAQKAVKTKEIDPIIAQAATLEDEVEYVCSKIYEILAKEPQYTYKDFAILARANNHLDAFMLALRKYDIPYQLVSNRGLYDRDEIRNLMALIKVLINPQDSISMYQALNLPSFDIDPQTITNLLLESRTNKISLWDCIQRSDEEPVADFYKTLKSFQEQISESTPTELIYNLVNKIGFLTPYILEETVENQLSIKNLDIFLKRVQQFEVEYHQENKLFPNLIEFADFIELMIEAGENPAQAEIEDIDTVNLMTVHSAKGLEYNVVFVVNLVSDRFPSRNQSDMILVPDQVIKETLPSGNEHIQEERRLFYVACTRAKKYLYLTLAKNYTGKRDKIPSGFLSELGLEIQQIQNETLKTPNVQDTLFGIESGFRDAKAVKISDFKPKFVSYSQLDMYESCPLQYKYKYILNIPTRPAFALSFGISIHDTLRDYHQKTLFQKVSLDELLDMYRKNWQPLGFMDENHRQLYFESGERLLKKYYEENKDNVSKPIALEKSFNLVIDGTRFYGKIDRIDPLEDGGVEIIDYKTGSPKDQKSVDKDDQVSLYAIGAIEALKLQPRKLTLYFVETGEKISTTRSLSELETKKKEFMETVKKITSGDFKATPGMQCKWCDYREFCPFALKNL